MFQSLQLSWSHAWAVYKDRFAERRVPRFRFVSQEAFSLDDVSFFSHIFEEINDEMCVANYRLRFEG